MHELYNFEIFLPRAHPALIRYCRIIPLYFWQKESTKIHCELHKSTVLLTPYSQQLIILGTLYLASRKKYYKTS